MVSEQDFIDLTLSFQKKSNCRVRLLALLWLPLAIFLIIISGYLGIIPLKTEIHSVILIGFIFIIFLFFMHHSAFYASCLFKKRFDTMKEELKTYINSNQLTIGETSKANATFDTFMRKFSSSLRNENFSSVAAGIFPTLGILGTFISIAISMPDFSSQTSDALEREISLLLGGVGTAFYVSIYGIFLSIWWIFYEKTGISRFEKDIRTIKEETHELFWEKEEIEQTYFQKSMENFEKLNAVFDNISSHAFIENINHTLTQRLEMFDNIIKSESQTLEKSSLQLRSNLEETQKSLQVREDLQHSYNAMLIQVEAFTDRMEESISKLGNIYEKLSDQEHNAETAIEHLSGNIEQLNQALSNISPDNVQNVYSGVADNLEMMKHEIERIGNSLDTRLNTFDEAYMDKLKQTLEMIDSETSQIVDQLSELKQDDDNH